MALILNKKERGNSVGAGALVRFSFGLHGALCARPSETFAFMRDFIHSQAIISRSRALIRRAFGVAYPAYVAGILRA
jgi:hypothetical protein